MEGEMSMKGKEQHRRVVDGKGWEGEGRGELNNQHQSLGHSKLRWLLKIVKIIIL
jgi:hypothetical protein